MPGIGEQATIEVVMKPSDSSNRIITWSARSVIFTLLILALAWGVVQVWDMILVILTAVVIASFVESLVRPLARTRVPRILIVVLVYVCIFVLLAGLMYLFIPAFIEEAGALLALLPVDDGTQISATFDALRTLGSADVGTADFVSTISASLQSGSVSSGLIGVISSVFGGLLNLVLVIVISVYLSVEERGIEKFIRVVMPIQHEDYVISLWRRTERKIGGWFKGQLLVALILAALTYLGLWILGVPYAFMLALLAGVFGLVPFGIFFAGAVAMLIGFLSGGVQMGLMVFLLYVILQQVEGYILQPLIINRATGVPSIVILLSIIFGAALWGFLGVILAIPLAVLLMEITRDREEKKLREMSMKDTKK